MTFPIDIANYAETVLPIPAANRLPKTSHRLDAPSLHAINAAVAAERPLLLRGEPGTGKSQLARAAAVLLGRRFAWKVVDAHTEVADLFYTFDAVERLARAQTLGALRIGDDDSDEDALMRLLDERRFVRPGPLWWAFDPVGAGSQDECYRRRCSREVSAYTQPTPTPPQPQQGFVVLLDEIDKTDPSVPNGLLEALGQGTFHVPGLDEPISLHDVDGAKRVAPLVVITTNEERELPSAFVRRCLVLQLHVPADDGELRSWLLRRGRAHYAEGDLGEEVLELAATMVIEDRRAAKKLGLTPPGQAEYLDMLRAVNALAQDDTRRRELLTDIRVFALKKHPDLHPDAEKAKR